MARTKQPHRKVSFSTRISPKTLDQLDELVRWGSYPNRTSAIEAAVARLADDADEGLRQKRRAFEETAGSLSLGTTPESLKKAEHERLEWEADRARGRG